MGAMTTMLFVPGDRPERVAKAVTSGADCVVIDLEDAVAASQKDKARLDAVAAVRDATAAECRIAVRVNARATGLLHLDIAALATVWSMLDLIVLPMVPDAQTVREVVTEFERADDRLVAGTSGPLLLPMIETARGVLAAPEIALASPRVLTLALGPADLSNDLNVTPSPDGLELLHARSQLVLAAAAAGRPAPIDGPWLTLDDDEGLRRSAHHAVALGFGGKIALHPRQLAIIVEAFSPSDAELAWAREVDAAFTAAESRGVSSVRLEDGSFVDYPVARRARALLDRAP
jgi:citrate lyase subunit beta/citryl-CoA lyase